MQRYQDWVGRLDRYFRESETKEFKRGLFDCALYVADGVYAMTGNDFAESFRGRYSSARGAAMALKKYGSGTLEETVTAFLGEPLLTVKKSQRGDVVLFETDEGPAIGIVDLTGTRFTAASETGIVRFPIKTALKAWRV